MTNYNFIDLKGKTFGRLTVTRRSDYSEKNRTWFWVCRCSCGKKNIKIIGSSLRKGLVKSCGCLLAEHCRKISPIGAKARNRQCSGPKVIFKMLYGNYKRRSERKGISFSIGLSTFANLIQGKCVYCGSRPFQITHNRNRSSIKHVGVDRLDPSMGYEEGNVVSCCKRCNAAKADMTVVEFKKWILKIHNHLAADETSFPK